MFRDPAPRLFHLPPGADFARGLVSGLRLRLTEQPPEAMARVTVYVNTTRMRRRVVEAFLEGGAGFLPRLRLLTDIAEGQPLPGVAAAVSPLRRRLELTQLISGLLDRQPDLAPRAALFDLADSLAGLMDEMQGEGVAPERIAALDVSDHSAHWARTREFLRIVTPFVSGAEAPDAETRQRLAVDGLTARWAADPPQDPVIVAGSTGSRGTTAALMEAVAKLPQGAIVLPGFDPHMPKETWDFLDDAMTGEDHPQFRMRRMMERMSISAEAIQPWVDVEPPSVERNRLISLSLRPAPVTDQWLREGRALTDLVEATKTVTLLEAETPRREAVSISLILRDAAERGVSAALITPDRMLTRRVAAALDRWGILPDDSAGRPLALSAPGRLLRHVAGLMGAKLASDALLTLLKHPLVFSGGDRGQHLLHTRRLELRLRRDGPAFPTGHDLRLWARARAEKREETGLVLWADELASWIETASAVEEGPLAALIERHLDLTERIARGTAEAGSGGLWEKEAGVEARALMESLQRDADAGGEVTPEAYRDLFEAVIARGEVRETVLAHPGILILGPREAREQAAEIVILAGLNDGSWPRLPEPDPWLNRRMRKEAGLLLPERQIGLSAHDYQIAIAAPQVVLSRAARDAEAETVPSRWLNRLTNLMEGLPEKRGPEALLAMRRRGAEWLALASALEEPTEAQRADPRLRAARRPSPRPPVAERPKELSLTRISLLIRDPYAIYCRYVLNLKRLDPLRHAPDAALRGQILHKILERFVRDRPENEMLPAAKARLMETAGATLEEMVPWPAARALWLARLARAADFFLAVDGRGGGTPVILERAGSVTVAPHDFRLIGTPDRIDRLPDGRLHILDYKTGSPPTQAMQKAFDKQLLLAAAMAERDGFPGLEASEVAQITYVGLGSNPKVEATEITPEITAEVWDGLRALVAHYADQSNGYTARRAVQKERFEGDYDHLSRFGEWDTTDPPTGDVVGRRR
ncbi:double-strand break repair protein AddB [Tabrizicola sp. TH137]|uniref:double-strand break repair protein AddB n=1 Tax=Tabrizicola sp. TH137 TaxID=2067452 RepID=UPI000C7DC72E|nr:double-strand break repair protein AddB [Tabrizicola sp. TH137]PLL14705.1 double-strand break repair protein AddB [Tabrizicola sp. TH137]